MMRRRLLAVLSVLALTLCVGRVSAWAASPAAGAHACCQAPKGRAPVPTMESCCPVGAAVVAPRAALSTVVTTAVVAAPRLPAPSLLAFAVAVPSAPPGASFHLATGLARAPPLA
jgi:hypothetical protein